MNVVNTIGMLFIIMIIWMFIGVGNIASTYEAYQHGQVNGTTAFLLIAGLIFALFLLIGVILAKINSWRSDDE